MGKPAVELHPDGRWNNLVGTYADLHAVADGWPTTTTTPAGVSDMLRISRDLFAQGYFVYEFLTVAALWSLFGVEAALRQRLDAAGKVPFANLITRAVDDGLLSPPAAVSLDAGREYRNRLVHARVLWAHSPGAAAELLRAAHHVVADLYPTS